jgi:hypothetical protein
MAVMLAGCAAVGNPTLPVSTVAVPQTWSNAATPAASSPQALEQWWRQFNDPLLDELIATAMGDKGVSFGLFLVSFPIRVLLSFGQRFGRLGPMT